MPFSQCSVASLGGRLMLSKGHYFHRHSGGISGGLGVRRKGFRLHVVWQMWKEVQRAGVAGKSETTVRTAGALDMSGGYSEKDDFIVK